MARRREFFFRISVLAAAPLASRLAIAQGGASKSDMHYQDKPNNGQRCADCIQFIPGKDPKGPGACKVVEGEISPNGWCIEFIKKS